MKIDIKYKMWYNNSVHNAYLEPRKGRRKEANMEKLKNKDYAKILYDLYRDNFNRVSLFSSVPTIVSQKQKERYEFCGPLCDEEVWAYENGLIFLSDEGPLNIVDMAREWPVNKHTFLIGIFLPLYQIQMKLENHNIPNEVIEEFIIETGICKELFQEEYAKKRWFSYETEISIQDAEKIVDSFQEYWKENM